MNGTRARRYLLLGTVDASERLAAFLRGRGHRVNVTAGGADDPQAVADLLAESDLLVPCGNAVPDDSLVEGAMARRIPIVSDIEITSRLIRCPIIGLVELDGSARVAGLVSAIVRHSGRRIFVCGHDGSSLIDAHLGLRSWDGAIVSLSVVQLQWLSTLQLACAAVVRPSPLVVPVEAGADSSWRRRVASLLCLQRADDTLVVDRDDAELWALRDMSRARVFSFGASPVEFGTYIEGDAVIAWDVAPGQHVFPCPGIAGAAYEDQRILMAAVSTALKLNLADSAIGAAIEEAFAAARVVPGDDNGVAGTSRWLEARG